jgi:hypothetical protein
MKLSEGLKDEVKKMKKSSVGDSLISWRFGNGKHTT